MMLFLLLLARLVSAHFILDYPGSRGFDEEKHAAWPCGGFNEPSFDRVSFPLSGAPVKITSTHTRQLLEVLLAVGNNPGENFNHVVVPTFQQEAPGEFCFGDVSTPIHLDLNLTAGSNATLQIISGGSEGGLYACVDVTFTSTPPSSEQWSQNCRNASQSKVSLLQDSSINANESNTVDLPTVSGSATASPPAPTSSSSSAGASLPTMASWVMGALGVAGGVLAL